MKNFIFISPNFPENYWRFCSELKKNGLRVLGIGDAPYADLRYELRQSLDEYYKVSDLENNDEVFRAVAFFSFKYGKIDFLESNNEYWLMRDAWLRTEFHITSGPKIDEMDKFKFKSAMKRYYANAGIPTARWRILNMKADAVDFVREVGYPIVIKPDSGVGANSTFKITSDAQLNDFLERRDDNVYIMEEYVNGCVQTFDGIVDAEGRVMFEAGNVTPDSVMDIVNQGGDCMFYLVKEISEEIRRAGLATIDAFGVRSRFVHLEFFVLREDQPGLGKCGDVLGLEVNMRPAGGFTPDMYNYAQETDVYKIWADMIAYGHSDKPIGKRRYCAFYSRRDRHGYLLSDEELLRRYRGNIVMHERIPEALSGAMADRMFIALFERSNEMYEFFKDAAPLPQT